MGREKFFVYEINTSVWLTELSQTNNRTVTFADVPDAILDDYVRINVDAIWLMGVWTRSAYAHESAMKYKHQYEEALPDLTDADIDASPYAVGAYEVDPRFGGRAGLAALRERLRARGIGLILDFVPNHVAADHAWIDTHPEYMIFGSEDDLMARPSDFYRHTSADGTVKIVAHGRDPYFAGWSDTAQLNAFSPALRAEVIALLLDIASQCDGVRCDMAMLMMNEIFASTWRGYVGDPPAVDYWREIIPSVRAQYPDFLFIAEVYWDKEWAIIQQGFNYAYDKTLYDRIVNHDVAALRAHLVAELGYQRHLIRFIENHDEPRAYETLGIEKIYPAMTLICTLPGACLLHDGQLTGRRVKLPVQISRAPEEPLDAALTAFSLRLLNETRDPIYETGEWYLFDLLPTETEAPTSHNLLAYGWRNHEHSDYRLIVINLTDTRSYAWLPLTFWSEFHGHEWRLHDVIDDSMYERDGREMVGEGLFISLAPFESHIFRFEKR